MNVNPRNFCSRCGRVHYDAGAMCSHCEAADRRNATMAAERLARLRDRGLVERGGDGAWNAVNMTLP